MKLLIVLTAFLFTGCAYLGPKDYNNYVDASRSISKDNTVAQTACWNAISEIAKSGDSAVRVGAIALAEKCKNNAVKIEAPKKNILGL